MDVEARQGASCSIKKTLRSIIRVSWRYASEHRGLVSLALLLYLLCRSSPRFFAFLLSSSPVIVCTSVLLGILLSYGIEVDLPQMDEGGKASADNSPPKFESYSGNFHMEEYKGCSVPAVLKDNIIREVSFGTRDACKHVDMYESVPLLKGGCQGDDRVDATDGRLGKMLSSVLSSETMQQEVGMVDKDAFLSDDKKYEHANLFDAVHQSGDEKDKAVREVVDNMTESNHEGGVFTESQSTSEVGGISEHKADDGDGAVGKRRWGRAFSVRRRKKLADIKIESINTAVDNQLDYSLLSPFSRAGSHDRSSGFDTADDAERYSIDVSMTDTAPVPDATETNPLLGGEDFSCPDRPTNNDNSENHSNVCSQDFGTDSDSVGVDDNGKAREDGEEKNDPVFLWTADDEKNAMDLGYSEIERNHRLELLMARRKSRKHMSFELDGSGGIANGVPSPFRPQALAISARQPNPFADDDAEVPGSAPSVLHRRENPFDFLSEPSSNGSDDAATTARHDPNPQQELNPALPHQDAFFKRHESFSFGSRPQQRNDVPRFKPRSVVLEELDLDDEESASNFQQRQFSDRSVSRLSVVSECDTVDSSVGDPEHNEAVRNCIRGMRESPTTSLLIRQDSDLVHPGNECSDGIISFWDNKET